MANRRTAQSTRTAAPAVAGKRPFPKTAAQRTGTKVLPRRPTIATKQQPAAPLTEGRPWTPRKLPAFGGEIDHTRVAMEAQILGFDWRRRFASAGRRKFESGCTSELQQELRTMSRSKAFTSLSPDDPALVPVWIVRGMLRLLEAHPPKDKESPRRSRDERRFWTVMEADEREIEPADRWRWVSDQLRQRYGDMISAGSAEKEFLKTRARYRQMCATAHEGKK